MNEQKANVQNLKCSKWMKENTCVYVDGRMFWQLFMSLFLPYAHILIYSLVKILICVHVYILKCEIFIEDEKKVEKILWIKNKNI